MWDQFQADYNFFTLLLNDYAAKQGLPVTFVGTSAVATGTRLSANARPDLCICGPFAASATAYSQLWPGVPKVFFTGEYVDIAPQVADIFLELGYNTYKTVPAPAAIAKRLPLWMLSIDWFGADNDRLINPRLMPLERCLAVDPGLIAKKNKFCSFIVSNPGNLKRNEAFVAINTYKPVDSAGRLYNNIGPQIFAGLGGGGGEHKKLAFLEDYKFSITYENRRARGYTTEKLLHAKAAGCVPIYWGDPEVGCDFNEAGFINANGLEGDALVAAVRAAEGRWTEIAGVPALDAGRVESIRKLFGEIAECIVERLGVQVPVEQPICYATFASANFIPSVRKWLEAVMGVAGSTSASASAEPPSCNRRGSANSAAVNTACAPWHLPTCSQIFSASLNFADKQNGHAYSRTSLLASISL
jgi:hypothetical protein